MPRICVKDTTMWPQPRQHCKVMVVTVKAANNASSQDGSSAISLTQVTFPLQCLFYRCISQHEPLIVRAKPLPEHLLDALVSPALHSRREGSLGRAGLGPAGRRQRPLQPRGSDRAALGRRAEGGAAAARGRRRGRGGDPGLSRLYYPLPSYPIPSYSTPSHPIPSCPVPSGPARPMGSSLRKSQAVRQAPGGATPERRRPAGRQQAAAGDQRLFAGASHLAGSRRGGAGGRARAPAPISRWNSRQDGVGAPSLAGGRAPALQDSFAVPSAGWLPVGPCVCWGPVPKHGLCRVPSGTSLGRPMLAVGPRPCAVPQCRLKDVCAEEATRFGVRSTIWS